MQKTFYDVLGITTDATQSAIKAAFRLKAQLVHPDKIQAQIAHLDPYAAERLKKALEEDFRDIKEAYDVLSNPRQRKEYDELLKQIQATSSPPPFNSKPPQTPPPPSAPPPTNFCTTCGDPLVGSSCTACAKQRGTNPLASGVAAIFWPLGTIFAVSVAVTLPRDDAWDADTCVGILVVFVAILLLAVRKGLWGGIKRLCKTHPAMGALSVEAALLAALSLVVGAFNTTPKTASTQTQTRPASLATTTIPAVKPATPEIKPPINIGSQRSVVQSLTGQFDGVVRNQTAGLSADFGIAVSEKQGTLSGCMVVKPPLYGSGPLSGVARGSEVSFVVTSFIGEITFSGRQEKDGLHGTYNVRHPNGASEEGTFALQKLKPGGIGSSFEGDCLKRHAQVGASALTANETPAGLVSEISAQSVIPPRRPASPVARPENPTNRAVPTESSDGHRASYFTLNATKDEVLRIQGTPTRLSEYEWDYGYSSIRFRNDRVVSWNNSELNPLRVRMIPSSAVSKSAGYFTVGSTRDEVLVIQGTPTRVSEYEWDYGYSSVRFRNDRVVSWNNSELNPLRVKMIPSSPK